ncbi:MAG: BLUF domain-containing protein [Pseudomonadota bacterium]
MREIGNRRRRPNGGAARRAARRRDRPQPTWVARTVTVSAVLDKAPAGALIEETGVICLAYLSTATELPDASGLEAILLKSRRNNEARGVTGILCHHDGSFMQFLEGPADQVLYTYECIRADPRHHSIVEVHCGPIAERLFPDWTMALSRIGDVGPEHHAFCQGLRHVELSAGAEHSAALEPFLDAFRIWIR